jgi:hypothetical protein
LEPKRDSLEDYFAALLARTDTGAAEADVLTGTGDR